MYRQGRKCALGQSGDLIDLARRHLHHERHPVAELPAAQGDEEPRSIPLQPADGVRGEYGDRPAMVSVMRKWALGMGSFSAGDDVRAGRWQRLQRDPLASPRTNLSTRQSNNYP